MNLYTPYATFELFRTYFTFKACVEKRKVHMQSTKLVSFYRAHYYKFDCFVLGLHVN